MEKSLNANVLIGHHLKGKREWLHVVSTSNLTLYQPHTKRGSQAMDDLGILSSYNGVVMHDFWRPYGRYGCVHTFCKAHLIRELRGIYENYPNQEWAKDLESLFGEMYHSVYGSGEYSPEIVAVYKKRYDEIVDAGLEQNPPGTRIGKRGKKKNSKAHNLLLRLKKERDGILIFLDIPSMPYTNNLAERDLRMMKVQQKISGSFRTVSGAVSFCRLRGYISILRKNGSSVFEALKKLVKGEVIPLHEIIGGE